jgi:carboxyl-terminal processing protease
VVTDVVENGPAEAAGFVRGDRIVAVNGQPMPRVNESLAENTPERQTQENENARAISKVVSTGEPVTLTVVRGGNARLEVNVQGKLFVTGRLPSLKTWSRAPANVAVLRIPDFEGPTVGQVIHDLVRKAQASGIKALIVDLRDNGGGRSTECLSGVGAFVGPVLRLRESKRSKYPLAFRDGVVTQNGFQLYQLKTVSLWQGPVVALVNAATGSCGEYFAADLQYAKRGVVLGETTAGVGNTGTQFLGLLDGSGLQVTTERALHADGTPYQEAVTPDIAIKDDLDELARSGRDLPLERAVQTLGL